MTRMTIEIDRELLSRVMAQHGYASPSEAVDAALRALGSLSPARADVVPMTTDEILSMAGSGWDGDLDELRGGRRD
jgi:Arc/MetJ family transcription regulator